MRLAGGIVVDGQVESFEAPLKVAAADRSSSRTCFKKSGKNILRGLGPAALLSTSREDGSRAAVLAKVRAVHGRRAGARAELRTQAVRATRLAASMSHGVHNGPQIGDGVLVCPA